MPRLILLNGPPASGKSTLAQLLVDDRPLALNLDIDVLRGQLGGWSDDPHNAGLRARELALAMARTHLRAGYDVVIPQYLGRLELIEQLDALADELSVPFVVVLLEMSRSVALDAIRELSRAPENQTHRDAAMLVQQSSSPDPIGEMFDALAMVQAQRPRSIVVSVLRGDIAATYTRLEDALAATEAG